MVDDVRPAFRSYETVDPSAPDGDGLNLAWTRDERECLSVDLQAVLADELRAEIADEHPYLGRYLVRDPYGEATLGPSIATAFGLLEWRGHITCGAGVVSLLHAFARLSHSVRVLGDAYPDLPAYVTQTGGTCTTSTSSPVWFLERPGITGDLFADLREPAGLGGFCTEAERHGAIVIVDESNANYYPPSWSAVGLALGHPNVAIIRGFSKAYGLGALRLAYCVASPSLTERIRTVVPPLLASSLSLRLGARVLALGDITAPLRARIAAHKREATELFERAGVGALVPASQHLPYVLSRDEQQPTLEARGIVGKRHPMWSAERAALCHMYRLSVPLSDARIARLRELLR